MKNKRNPQSENAALLADGNRKYAACLHCYCSLSLSESDPLVHLFGGNFKAEEDETADSGGRGERVRRSVGRSVCPPVGKRGAA